MWGSISIAATAARILSALKDFGYRYVIHPGETAAGLTAADLKFGYGVGNWLRYGADRTGVADSRTAIQHSLNVAHNNGIGSSYGPRGTYQCSGNLTIYPDTTMEGDGRNATVLQFTHAGDGINQTSAVNASTAVRIEVRDLAITCSNAANAGGGYVDLGGSMWTLRNLRFEGFKWGVILDQSEIAAIRDCDFTVPAIADAAGCWMVNGADHTVGANGLFTNRITVDGCQFNAATGATNYGVCDDGGTNHTISNCNVNAPSFGMRFAEVFGLTLIDNESEVCASVDCDLEETTAGIGLLGSRYVGPVVGFKAIGNLWISSGVSHNLRLASARNGLIGGNVFGQGVGECISFFGGASNPCSGIVIEGNEKLVTGNGKTAAPFISAATLAILRANKIRQVPVTYVATALAAAGAQVITPESMESIKVGTRLICRNNDGSNTEQVYVTAVTGATFTAIFASTKAANWVIGGCTPADEEEGTWSPTLSDGAHSANTYTASNLAKYSRRGNLVVIRGTLDISAKDATMAGALQIGGLPYPVANITGQNAVIHIPLFTGLTSTGGYTTPGGLANAGTSVIALRWAASGKGLTTLQAGDLPGANLTLYFEGSYETDAA